MKSPCPSVSTAFCPLRPAVSTCTTGSSSAESSAASGVAASVASRVSAKPEKHESMAKKMCLAGTRLPIFLISSIGIAVSSGRSGSPSTGIR